RKADAPRYRRLLDFDGEPITVSRVKLLGIVHTQDPRSRRKYDGGGRDRARKRAHARFVDAGDAEHAARPQRGLIAQQLTQPLALGTVLKASAGNGVQDRLGARAL